MGKGSNGTTSSAKIRMCTKFCSDFHASCSNTTAAEVEGNGANAFCQVFIDTSKGRTVELNQYNCFNDVSAPNTCDGSRSGDLLKDNTQWFIIVCSIILGLMALALIFVVCNNNNEKTNARYFHSGSHEETQSLNINNDGAMGHGHGNG